MAIPGRPHGNQKYRSTYPDKVRKYILSKRPGMVTHRELAKLFNVATTSIPYWCKIYPEFNAAEKLRFE